MVDAALMVTTGCAVGSVGLMGAWVVSRVVQTPDKVVRQHLRQLLSEQQQGKTPDDALRADDSRLTKKTKAAAPSNAPQSVLKKRANDHTWRHRLETDLERANLLIRVDEYLLFRAVIGLAVAGITWFYTHWPWLTLVPVALVGFWATSWVLGLRIWLRMRKARLQFPEVLDSMVACFKTGYGFNRAVQQIADTYADPWGTEFGKMALETSLGSPMDEVLQSLLRRVPNPDVELFVASMLIQKDTGGNLTELLGNLSHTCRERFKLARKIAAISAQGKLTAIIVCLVPLLILTFMYLFMGEAVTQFVSMLIGQIILGVMGVWMLIGMGVLWKMVQIEV